VNNSYAVPATVSRPKLFLGVHSSKPLSLILRWEGSTKDKPGDLPRS